MIRPIYRLCSAIAIPSHLAVLRLSPTADRKASVTTAYGTEEPDETLQPWQPLIDIVKWLLRAPNQPYPEENNLAPGRSVGYAPQQGCPTDLRRGLTALEGERGTVITPGLPVINGHIEARARCWGL
jgi:hypothetical protein